MAHRTRFAGLAAPDRGDSSQVLNADFIYANPDLTDQFLRIGALTHRHSGQPGLPNPLTAVTLVGSQTGGSLDAGTYYATYTAVDAQGGETMAAPVESITLIAGVQPPVNGPSAAVSSAGGIMPDGNYAYATTFTDGAGGETTLSPPTWTYIDPGFASAEILLSGLTPGAGATNWRLWRSYEGEDWHLVAQGSGDTYLDTGFDPPDNPARPPATNTTGGTSQISLSLPGTAEPALASATSLNVYLSLDPTMPAPSLFAVLPIACAGTTLTITDDIVVNGSPPNANLSIGGAAKIFGKTEVIGWQTLIACASGIASGGSAISGSANAQGKLQFTGSGGAQVFIRDLGGGSAQIIISAPSASQGPQGPQGIQGIQGIQGPPGTGGGGGSGITSFEASAANGSANVTAVLAFAGSGGTGVQLINSGGGSAVVLISAPTSPPPTGSGSSLNVGYVETSSANVVISGASTTTPTDVLTLPPIPAGTKGPVNLHLSVPAILIANTTAYVRFEIIDDLGNVVGDRITPVNNVTANWFAGGIDVWAKVENPAGRTYKVRAYVPQGGGNVTLEPWTDANGKVQPIYFQAIGTYINTAGFLIGSAAVTASGSAAVCTSAGTLVVVGNPNYVTPEGSAAVLQLDPIPPLYIAYLNDPSMLSADGGNTPLVYTSGTPAISGNQIKDSAGTDQRVLLNLPYFGRKPIRDGVVQVKYVPAITNPDFSLTMGDSNLWCQFNAGTVTFKSFVGGTFTIGTAGSFTFVAGNTYWIRFETRSGQVYLEVWTKDPATRLNGDAPAYALSGALSTTATRFAYGRPGIRLNTTNDVVQQMWFWDFPEGIT